MSNFEKDCKHLDFFNLFESIKEESNKYDFSIKAAKENKNLNRYRDVNPYDYSRIILTRGSCDFINANLVPVEKAHRKYILTQGPLPNTISHFWAMVWEQNSKSIVMLNKIIENNRIKCHQYWPSRTDDPLDLSDVSLKVSFVSETAYQYYTVRTFELTDTETDEKREVLHYHYMTWPDFGVPKSPKEFLRFLRAVRKSGSLDENVGAPIVHCSAGIGRSGTFCLVDSCLVMIAENGENSIEVREVGEVLLDMRKYRMGLVQTVQQLRFSFLAIVEGMKSSWLHNLEDSPEDDEKVDSQSESEEEPPPLPPPRTESLRPERPAPISVESSPSSSPDEESPPGASPAVEEPTGAAGESKPIENGVDKDGEEAVRQRKAVQADKQKRLAEKVEEMKRKQDDAEYWERIKRSLKPYVNFLLIGVGGLAFYYLGPRGSN
nr:PREDICTED: tyrosine-protein phosphatase non-receptor type 1-like isoform X1 [Bemisia tabaci]